MIVVAPYWGRVDERRMEIIQKVFIYSILLNAA
ncbi:hypothetical protein HRbin03_00427 [archaeon HR03]|nr:hypothetical protein HRbin03_00427 [archaeon HR03]